MFSFILKFTFAPLYKMITINGKKNRSMHWQKVQKNELP